jgi:hypothetical protein
MPITIQCPNCCKKLNARDELAGKRVKCPACGEVIQPRKVPALAAAMIVPPAPPTRASPAKAEEATVKVTPLAPWVGLASASAPARATVLGFLSCLRAAAGEDLATHYRFWLAHARAEEIEEGAERYNRDILVDSDPFTHWWIGKLLVLLHPERAPASADLPPQATCAVCGRNAEPLDDLHYFHAYVKKVPVGRKDSVDPSLPSVEKGNHLYVGYQESGDHVCPSCVRARRRCRQKWTLLLFPIFWALAILAVLYAQSHQQAGPALLPGIIAIPLLVISVPFFFALLFAGWQVDGQIIAMKRNRERFKAAGLPKMWPGLLRDSEAVPECRHHSLLPST